MSVSPASPISAAPNAPADLEAGLNAQQLEAFRHTKGAALVLAGAGSGKATVLLRRIARLLLEGVPPERVLVMTFTKRAAEEMLDRLNLLLGEEGEVWRKGKYWRVPHFRYCWRIR